VDRAPARILAQADGAGTVIFNLAVQPGSRKVFASNLESRNVQRFESELRGRFVDNRITGIVFACRRDRP
jgi:hypothetical protein